MVDIVGLDGNPLRQAEGELKEPQTSKMGFLHSEYEGHPSRGLTPSKLAHILQQAEQGDLQAQCELFEDMEEKDAHIFAELSKRKRALVGLDWSIQPPRNATPQEEKAVAFIKDLLEDYLCLEDVILDIADSIGKGYSNLEMVWKNDDGVRYPEITHRPASWFQADIKDRNTLLLRNQTAEGEAMRPLSWISHVHKSKSGYPGRSALLRVLAWPYLFKNYSVRDLAEFLEIYGLPMRLGKYPPGSSESEKMTLLRAVVGIGHNAAGIIPEGMSIDFMDAADGSEEPFEAMINWCERSQSKAILGGTLTSGTGDGTNTNALGNVHNEMRLDLMQADAKQVAKTITRDLIWPLVQLNLPGITSLRRCPSFGFDTEEPEDIKLLADSLPKLVKIGLRVKEEEVRQRIGFEEPGKDDVVLGVVKPNTDKPEPSQAEATAIAALVSGKYADNFDDFADDLSKDWERVMSPTMQPVLDAINTADNYADFESKLAAAVADMKQEELVELLSNSGFMARVFGRLNNI